MDESARNNTASFDMSNPAQPLNDDVALYKMFCHQESAPTYQDCLKSVATSQHHHAARSDSLIRRKMSKLLQGKEDEWAAIASRTGPLQLLDLSVDVLREIIKEVCFPSVLYQRLRFNIF